MGAINQLLTVLLCVGQGDAGGAPADCAELSRALKEQEDRYWKVYRGEVPGDHLEEGRKIGPLRWKLRACGAKPKATASSDPSAAETAPAPRQQSKAKRVSAKPSTEASSVSAPAAPREQRSATTVPPSVDESAFCGVVKDYGQQYSSVLGSGGNQLKLSKLRSARAEALRQASGSTRVSGWTATLGKLSTTGDGRAAVQVKLPCKATLKTWNNTFSDSSSNTLVPHASPLYEAIAELREGQTVVVEGQLFRDDQDWYKETSLTERGSMVDPEFLFRFSSIRAR